MNQHLFSSVSQKVGAAGPWAHGTNGTRSTRSAYGRTGRTLTVVVMVAALLSGCTGSPAAEDTPNTSKTVLDSESATPTATPTPTQTPTPTYKPASADGPAQNVPLPTLPPEAKKETKAGLEAFAKYWFELVNYGYETGDLAPVKDLSGPSCTACNSYYEVVERGYENGDWLGGGHIEIDGLSTTFKSTDMGSYQTIIDISQRPTTYYSPTGTYGTPELHPPGVLIMETSYVESQWHVTLLETIK